MLHAGGCAREQRSFATYPGFAEFYAAHPRSPRAASPAEQALLRRYRPRWMMPGGQPGPIDFYADYIAHGVLADGAGNIVSTQVTREILNRYRDDPAAIFRHQTPAGPVVERPVVYARTDPVSWRGRQMPPRRFTLLTYNLVFRTSGLPAGTSEIADAVLSLIADPVDWHQLDHYTAATIVLDESDNPVALMLQQHNQQRTWVLGVDLPLPCDGRLRIDVALRSNELYPHVAGPASHRAIPFPTRRGMRYLMGFDRPPWLSALDIVESTHEKDFPLEFLPADDAFYAFHGWLGERRLLPGRDGPPGADYNTMPQLKPSLLQLASGYWHEGNRHDLAILERAFEDGGLSTFAIAQLPLLLRALPDNGANMSTRPCLTYIPHISVGILREFSSERSAAKGSPRHAEQIEHLRL